MLWDMKCERCQHIEEYDDRNLNKCTKCGSAKLKKHYTPRPIHFKGRGFYKTDNKGRNGKR